MPKKDTTDAVLGMLSSAGAATRAAAPDSSATSRPRTVATVAGSATQVTSVESVLDAPPAVSVTPQQAVPPAPAQTTAGNAPRTMRLQKSTAHQLRAAWLEAKRDDVLLTAQDFASALVDEALIRRQRSRAAKAV